MKLVRVINEVMPRQRSRHDIIKLLDEFVSSYGPGETAEIIYNEGEYKSASSVSSSIQACIKAQHFYMLRCFIRGGRVYVTKKDL